MILTLQSSNCVSQLGYLLELFTRGPLLGLPLFTLGPPLGLPLFALGYKVVKSEKRSNKFSGCVSPFIISTSSFIAVSLSILFLSLSLPSPTP